MPAPEPASPAEVLAFWFSDRVKPHWFRSTPALDQEIRDRFEDLWRRGAEGGLGHWEETAEGAVALAIVLDQFPLNMFRNDPLAFSSEAAARAVADRAIARGLDQTLSAQQQAFLYLPFMHSESLADQDRSVALFSRPDLDYNLTWARHHRDIVARFGRFPHRNAILGRESSPEERAWLDSEAGYQG